MKLSHHLQQHQKLTITPFLQHAVKLLRLTHLEIIDLMAQEIKQNPLLEEIEDSERGYKKEEFKTYERQDIEYENIASREKTLAEHLLWQFRMEKNNSVERNIAEFIIHNVNSDGYLEVPFDVIVSKSGEDKDLCCKIWKKIKMLDPVGCGSENLMDCLLIQAEVAGERSNLLEKIIMEHLSDVECGNLEKIAQKTDKTLSDVRYCLQTLKKFYPRPGRAVSFERTHYIIPDVYIHSVEGEFIVRANNEGIPQLKISEFYRNMLDNLAKDSSDRAFIQEKIRDANWMIKSLQNRQKTITKVVTTILKKQQDFFKRKSKYLRPMILGDIAQDVGVHESTVSRATTNKYVHTPLGLFELKFFFTSGIGDCKGEKITHEFLKEKICEICEQEDPLRPHTDRKIADLLKGQDINLARRTVAKYREEVGIPPSLKRKKIKESL